MNADEVVIEEVQRHRMSMIGDFLAERISQPDGEGVRAAASFCSSSINNFWISLRPASSLVSRNSFL